MPPAQVPMPNTLPSTPEGKRNKRGALSPGFRRSVGGSRRLAGIVTLLRPRKSQRLQSETGASDKLDACGKGSVSSRANLNVTSSKVENHRKKSIRHAFRNNDRINGACETRNTSDRTMISGNSDITSATVCHHPSQRTLTPITVVSRELCQDPFDDLGGTYHILPSSNPFSEPVTTTNSSTRPSSLECSGLRVEGVIDKIENPFTQESYTDLGNSSAVDSSRSISANSTCSFHIDKRTAAVAFNELAIKVQLDPLALCQYDGNGDDHDRTVSTGKPFSAGEDEPTRRRDKVLGRIRTVRSGLHIKPSPAASPKRALRRMKTFAGLSPRAYEMKALRGRTLENLARLGGHSFLDLPVDFAPATLRLPTCFVATISYLKCFAFGVPGVFADIGSPKMAARIYQYFTSQVFSAEKECTGVEVTVRNGEMPLDLVEILGQRASHKVSLQVLSVAGVLKALLAGLPGGILGSVQLYRVLVNICYGRVMERNDRSECAENATSQDNTRIRAIGLAILALASPMRVNLICAVIGLCTMLVYDAERAIELDVVSGLLTMDRLGSAFGPLLTEGQTSDEQDTFCAIEREIENQRVMSMLIDSWRGVSHQLRVWHKRGTVSQRTSVSRTVSCEPLLARTASGNIQLGEAGHEENQLTR
ncbi:hypothetical protein BDV25DRAFT_145757 [Aspergillus avenaceus]|uniref:Uncharacterized protein n=1 Tax=Aspergillus avenaceus TaxID=36643 RepID=A0A5N6TD77_ASPAV|nr:hypothetical protein BDV25DRAFT_145757 [Aspergillus avenaceus]